MTTEILWCQTHEKPAVFDQVVAERRICGDGFSDNIHPCEVVPMLLVRKDAPSITIDSHDGVADPRFAGLAKVGLGWLLSKPAGRYVLVEEKR